MNSGIYQIRNVVNNKVYIGQAINVFRRLSEHCDDLIQNKHFNRHLQRSFNKYKSENFEYSIICSVPVDQLNLAEKAAIYMFTSTNPLFGFNKTFGGEGGSPTEEIKKKMSIARSGENHPLFGKHHSEETKMKISLAHIGISAGENNPMFGKKHSEETRRKMSNDRKGKTLSEEHRRKMSVSRSKITWKIITPTEQILIIKNLNQFCKNNNLSSSRMSEVCAGKRKQHKGYRIEKVLDENE